MQPAQLVVFNHLIAEISRLSGKPIDPNERYDLWTSMCLHGTHPINLRPKQAILYLTSQAPSRIRNMLWKRLGEEQWEELVTSLRNFNPEEAAASEIYTQLKK